MAEQATDLDRLPIGTRVRLDSPGGWFHGLTGTVHYYPDEYPWGVTVEIPGHCRALARHDELRVVGDR